MYGWVDMCDIEWGGLVPSHICLYTEILMLHTRQVCALPTSLVFSLAQQVTKSECVFDTQLAIRLKDKSGNYFYQDSDEVPPKLVVRVEAGLAFCPGAESQCRSYDYQGDVCQYTIPADTCEVCASIQLRNIKTFMDDVRVACLLNTCI